MPDRVVGRRFGGRGALPGDAVTSFGKAGHALARWRAFCRSYQLVLVIKRGNLDTGLPLLRAAFEEHDEGGSTDLRVGAFRGSSFGVPVR
jgi:hypothetical protein